MARLLESCIFLNDLGPKPNSFADEDASLDEAPLRGLTEADGWDVVTEAETAFWVFHVWVHAGNPDGVFASANPRFDDMPGCAPP